MLYSLKTACKHNRETKICMWDIHFKILGITDTVLKDHSESPSKRYKGKTFTKKTLHNNMVLEIDSMFQSGFGS